MSEFLFLKPVLKEMIWGGNRLSSLGYSLNSDKTGEAWVISAHENGESVCIDGEYNGYSLKGMGLNKIWEDYPEIFGFESTKGRKFPLLIKYIDAKDDLSIQVHPDDKYASKYENGAKGKTECWYVLDCDENADIVIGHNAESRDGLKKMIDEGRWNELLNIIPIKKGDFFYIEAGTVHAIRKGTLILEVQQNSDVTYRVYDYDRLQNGAPRELHIEKSLDVINVPSVCKDKRQAKNIFESGYMEILVDEKFFTVEHVRINGSQKVNLDNNNFYMVNVIKGSGIINDTQINMGDNFIIPSNIKGLDIRGDVEMIISMGK